MLTVRSSREPVPLAALFLHHVLWWFDAIHAQVDFPLAAVMRYVHSQQNFSPREPSVGRILRLADLFLTQAWDHRRAKGKRIAQKFDDLVLLGRVGSTGGSESFKPAQN